MRIIDAVWAERERQLTSGARREVGLMDAARSIDAQLGLNEARRAPGSMTVATLVKVHNGNVAAAIAARNARNSAGAGTSAATGNGGNGGGGASGAMDRARSGGGAAGGDMDVARSGGGEGDQLRPQQGTGKRQRQQQHSSSAGDQRRPQQRKGKRQRHQRSLSDDDFDSD